MVDRRTIVKNASKGDPVAIEELLAAYLPRLRAFVRLRMGPELRAKESASDLVQSVCREVLEGLQGFEYRDERQFCGWMFTTTLRKIQGRAVYYKAAKRDVGREVAAAFESETNQSLENLGTAYADVVTPSKQAMLRERIEKLEGAFDQLSDAHREVITLSKIAGLSHKEIAAIIGSTEAATRALLFRALAELAVAAGVDSQERG